MKKFLFLLLASFSITIIAQAQPGGGRGQSPEAMKQMLKDSLNLNDKQLDSVTAILQEFMPKQREIFMNQDLSREEKASQLKELNEARNKRLKAILTKEQMEKYKEMEDRRRQRMMGGGRNGN